MHVFISVHTDTNVYMHMFMYFIYYSDIYNIPGVVQSKYYKDCLCPAKAIKS